MAVQFQILGRIQIKDGNRVFDIPSAPVRGAMAVLLLEEGSFVSVDHLLLALWDAPPKSAPSNLRLYLSRLRAQLRQRDPALGDKLVTLRGNNGGAYGLLVEPGRVDSSRFKTLATQGIGQLLYGHPQAAEKSLTEALALWSGPIGVDCTASVLLRSRFETLNELRLTARERLVEAQLGLGRSHDLIPEIHDLLRIAPFREASWSNLIRACYLGGDVAGACAAWDRAHSTLRDELGLDVSPDLQRLHLALLRREDSIFM